MELKCQMKNDLREWGTFKLYLYGIEMPEDCRASSSTLRSNCTFMELKLSIVSRLISSATRSNCTFMELKLQTIRRLAAAISVQIVPLWNWNWVESWVGRKGMQFKLYLYGIEMLNLRRRNMISESSNCTFMELKSDSNCPEDHRIAFKLYLYGIEMSYQNLRQFCEKCSNCTFMELKYRQYVLS